MDLHSTKLILIFILTDIEAQTIDDICMGPSAVHFRLLSHADFP